MADEAGHGYYKNAHARCFKLYVSYVSTYALRRKPDTKLELSDLL